MTFLSFPDFREKRSALFLGFNFVFDDLCINHRRNLSSKIRYFKLSSYVCQRSYKRIIHPNNITFSLLSFIFYFYNCIQHHGPTVFEINMKNVKTRILVFIGIPTIDLKLSILRTYLAPVRAARSYPRIFW